MRTLILVGLLGLTACASQGPDVPKAALETSRPVVTIAPRIQPPPVAVQARAGDLEAKVDALTKAVNALLAHQSAVRSGGIQAEACFKRCEQLPDAEGECQWDRGQPRCVDPLDEQRHANKRRCWDHCESVRPIELKHLGC